VDAGPAIEDSCTTKNYRDPTLKVWHQTPVPSIKKEVRHASSFMAWPQIVVYCWGNNITIKEGNTTQTTPCPTYAFVMNASQTFQTSDNMVNHMARAPTRKNVGIKAILRVQDAHFDDYRFAHQQINENINQIDELRQQADNQVAYQDNNVTITWKVITIAVLSIIIAIPVIYFGLRIWFSVKNLALLSAVPLRRRENPVKRESTELRNVVAQQLNESITTVLREEIQRQRDLRRPRVAIEDGLRHSRQSRRSRRGQDRRSSDSSLSIEEL
jgi:hypothetical protein